MLNPAGVNCIRYFAREGIRVWGARTLADAASEWRYLNVRRLFNMIEESIAEATRWIVFEPNDRDALEVDPARRRRVPDAGLARRRAHGPHARGSVLRQVRRGDQPARGHRRRDASSAIIGIAPVKPAEFVIFRISQSALAGHRDRGGLRWLKLHRPGQQGPLRPRQAQVRGSIRIARTTSSSSSRA